MTAARFCKGKVLVAGDESATSEVYALPNGTLQATTAEAPQRVLQPDGSWLPVDLTLTVNADGSVGPTRSAYPTTMSGGTTATGTSVLASIGTGDNATSVEWTGALSTPTLAGNTATYVNARPGLDVVVKATASGLEQNIVLRNRAAIGEIQGLSLPVVSKAEASYSRSSSGGASLKDAKGHAFMQIPQMLMWDAATDPATQLPDKVGVAATVTSRAPTGGQPAGITMALTPDLSWLNDPTRQFPITLDPTLNPESTTFDTYVEQGSSTDYSGDSDLQLGPTSGNITRAFLSWNMTGLQHAVISAAQVYFYDYYSQSCTAAQWDMWYDTVAATSSTTYATQPAGVTNESNSTQTKGFSSTCDDGWIQIDGKNFFAAAAAAGGSRGYMQLRAHDESGTSIGFKQVRSRNADNPAQVPYAVITYTSVPVIGTRSTVPTSICATGSGAPYLASKTPTFKSVVTDGDGATSTVNIEWWNAAGTTRIGTGSVTGVASGNTAAVPVPSGQLAEGTGYEWRVDASSGGATSAWSSWCAFTVDTTAPGIAPSVSSTDYPAGVWAGAANQAGSFALGAAGVTDVNSYLYGLDTNPPTTSAPDPTLGGSIAVSVTPTTTGPHTLFVESVDRAGNVSPLTSYSFDVGSAALTSPAVGSTTAQWTQLQGAAPAGTTGVTYQWRRADTDTWTNIPTGDVNLTVGGGPVTWPVAPSGGAYPSLNWNVKETLANANTPAGLTGRWLLNDTTGSTAADVSGLGNPGTCVSVTWSGAHGGSAIFNGTTSQITTAHTVVNTAGSFTVSAWVNLTSTSANEIAVSESSAQQSGFDLRYQKSSNKWVFGRWNADIANAPTFITASTPFTALNTWTHLVGTFNVSTGLMTVYANGVASTSTNTDTTPFAATGGLVIGHGEFNGAATSYFTGNIADVQTYNTVLTAAQVTAIYGGLQVAGSGAALSGPVEARAVFTGGPGGTSPQTNFTLDPNAASGATSTVGPGSVNLVTGNLAVSASDVSVNSYGSDLTTARTFNTRQAGTYDSTHMFGPGWTSTATVADAGSPYTGLTVAGSLVQVGLPDGSTVGFTNSVTTGKYVPQVGAEDLTLTYTSGSNPYYTLSDQDGNMVTFTAISGAPAGQFTPTSVTEPGSGQTSTMTWQTATVDGITVTRPTQLLAPVPAGVTCTSLVKGCRALTFSYASTTTATGTTQATWGDYTGRVKAISFTAWDPSSSAMKTVALANYLYDINGRLVAAWDPRLDNGATHLWTVYSYNTDGTLATITDNTEPVWNLTYTTLPGDLGAGRLASASQSALTAGTATTTVVYNVPLTTGSGGPYDMSVSTTTQWNETAAPVQATAVFDPGQIPTGNQATGVMPSSWTRATVTYLDADSRTINTATPGGNIDTSWYDQYGNVVQSLTAADRAEALTAAAGNLTVAQDLTYNYSTFNTYSPDGTQQTFTKGPYHITRLADGTTPYARNTTTSTYDEGAPVGTCPCGLVTTQTDAVMYWTGGNPGSGTLVTNAEPRKTTTTYNWTLREPLVVTVDPAGLALTTTTGYDPTTGLVTAVTAPAGGATINTPATTLTTYYSTATNSTYPECGGHADWANLVCRTGPGGQPASGPELPATETSYDMYNNPTVVTEKTSAGTLRTTTSTFDAAERVLTTAIVGTAGTGTAIPTQRNVYDPATGNLLNVQSLDAGNNVTAYTTTVYDALNRITSYTDTDGVQSTTSYDLMSRPTTVSDGAESTTTSYDTGGENRGLATQIVDAQAGTITGSYDAAGNLTQETWSTPGITVTHTYNEIGTQTGITYIKNGCGQSDCTLYSDTDLIGTAGQVTSNLSTFEWDGYTYDLDSRLTQAQEYGSGGCTTRVYAFGNTTAGKASDRTSLTSYNPNTDGTCQTTTSATSSTWTYDTADRTTTTGYVYDSLGRATSVPAVDTQTPDGGNLTVSYNVNNLVHTIQQGTRTAASYMLDVDQQRIRSWTDTAGVTHTNHYGDTTDSPSWTNEGNGAWTRPINGLGGMVAIGGSGGNVEWQLSNLHDDIVATTSSAAGFSLDSTSVADEFGNMQQASQVGADRYAWLGAKQRGADNPDGIVLMGVRLYNPVTGRFLSTDPVLGGSCNRYDYTCQDPRNGVDLDGRCYSPICWHWSRAWHSGGLQRAGHGISSIVRTIAHIHWVKYGWARRFSSRHPHLWACVWGGTGGGIFGRMAGAISKIAHLWGAVAVLGCFGSIWGSWQ